MPAWWRGWFARTEPRGGDRSPTSAMSGHLRAAWRRRASGGEPQGASMREGIRAHRGRCRRVLGLQMFDVQLQGPLAAGGRAIAEMQTGEGKTLAAVPAVVWYARSGDGVHVLTANDYLARRDAAWMRGIYSVVRPVRWRHPAGPDSIAERQAAYRPISPTPPPMKQDSTTCAIGSP